MVLANHVAPHIWLPGLRDRATATATAAAGPRRPSRRTRQALAGLTPKAFEAPSFNEADMSDKETIVRARAKLAPRALKQLNLARIRSLLSVDEAVAHAVGRARARPASSTTPTSSSPPTTATPSASTATPARTGSPTRSSTSRWWCAVPASPPARARTARSRWSTSPPRSAQLMSLTPTLTTDGETFAADPARPGGAGLPRHDADPDRRQGSLRPVPRLGLPRRADPALLLRSPVNNGPTDGFLYDRHKDPYELKNLLTNQRYAPYAASSSAATASSPTARAAAATATSARSRHHCGNRLDPGP